MSTSLSSLVSVSGRELSVEVDPEASALRVGGARVESQWGRAFPKEVSAEVVESTEAADEGGSWDASLMVSSLTGCGGE